MKRAIIKGVWAPLMYFPKSKVVTGYRGKPLVRPSDWLTMARWGQGDWLTMPWWGQGDWLTVARWGQGDWLTMALMGTGWLAYLDPVGTGWRAYLGPAGTGWLAYHDPVGTAWLTYLGPGGDRLTGLPWPMCRDRVTGIPCPGGHSVTGLPWPGGDRVTGLPWPSGDRVTGLPCPGGDSVTACAIACSTDCSANPIRSLPPSERIRYRASDWRHATNIPLILSTFFVITCEQAASHESVMITLLENDDAILTLI